MSFLQQQLRLVDPASVESTWNSLERGLTDIYRTLPLARDRYMHLYHVVYRYCVSNSLTLPEHSRSYLSGCQLRGEKLYRNLHEFLRRHLASLTDAGSAVLVSLFPARRCASAGTSYCPVSVCPSVCLSQVGVLSKRLDESIWVLACELFPPILYTMLTAIRVSSKLRVLPS